MASQPSGTLEETVNGLELGGRGLPVHAVPSLSVVIPAYNESQCIASTVEALVTSLSGLSGDYEILVIDDGSTDSTCAAVEQLIARNPVLRLLRQPENRGKGAAVCRGMLAAEGDVVVFMDADLPYRLDALEKSAKIMADDGADIVLGARDLPESETVIGYGSSRRMASRIFSWLVSMLAVRGIPDTQCGFKCFSRKAAQDIFSRITITGFGFDPEVLHIAQRRCYRIVRIPVALRHRGESKVRLVRDSFKMVGDLVRIRLRSMRGRYDV